MNFTEFWRNVVSVIGKPKKDAYLRNSVDEKLEKTKRWLKSKKAYMEKALF